MSSFEGKKEEESLSDKVRKNFEDFLSRSDEPGEFLTPAKKEELIKESLTDPKALEILEKDRESKYRTNSLGVISWVELFLSSEDAKNVPIDQKEKLLQRIKKVNEEIAKEKPLGFKKELVDEVVGIVGEVKQRLK